MKVIEDTGDENLAVCILRVCLSVCRLAPSIRELETPVSTQV